jgi:peptidoglycan/xylan/chitin deacetylase (PgdA/CDA1 family)
MVVFVFSAIQDFLMRLFGGTPRGSCVVLYYHSIPADQRRQFSAQMDVLLRCAAPIQLTDNVELRAGAHQAAVTFDDGFENFYENALPELVSRRIPAVMFVIAEASGKGFGPMGHSEKVMSLDQLRSLPEDLVTIGSHTLTHPMLPAISEAEALREIGESRTKLKQMLNHDIQLFSFPFGGFNERLVEVCKDAGYSRVFTTLPNFAFADANEFAVGRVRVDPTDWPLEFRLKLAGAYRWLPVAFRLKRIMVPSWLKRSSSGNMKGSHQSAEPRSSIQDLGVQ